MRGYPVKRVQRRVRFNPLLMVVNPVNKRSARRHVRRNNFIIAGKTSSWSRRRYRHNPDLREGFWDDTSAALSSSREYHPFSPAPFKEGTDIPIKEFEEWLYNEGTSDQIKDYEKAKMAYKKFHLGAKPKSVTRELMDISSNKVVTDRTFSYSMGKSTHETYNAPKHSKKSGAVYIHRYDDKPEALVFPGGKLIMKKLKGRARIDDWMRG